MTNLSKVNKGLLIPVLALIALIVKQTYKISISESSINLIADVLLGGISAVGFFMHPKSKAAQQEATQAVAVVVKDVVQTTPAVQPTEQTPVK